MRSNPYVPVLLAILFIAAGTVVWSQEDQEEMSTFPPPESQPTIQPAPKQTWTPEELNNLVAPIALYPDPLLGQMLVASTYPLEVVEASQWLERHKNLSGRNLLDAAKQESWDPSVQALIAVPDALEELNRDIGWTTELGDAFLAQQAEVMSAVQNMRARAQANGRLRSTPQQTVEVEDQGGRQVIAIEPASPEVIYVPYYDPAYIWGPPVYGYYPPLYYPRWGFGFGSGFDLSFCFDSWGGWSSWGWEPNWFGRVVYVNNLFFPRYGFHDGFRSRFGGRTIWAHDPGHRFGVPYRNRRVSDRFERASIASRSSFRSGATRNFRTDSSRNPSAGRFSGRTPEQGYRRTTNPQRNQVYRGPRNTISPQRDQAYRGYRNTTSPQRNQADLGYRNAANQQRGQAYQSYRSATTQQSNQSYQGNRGYRTQSYQAPQQYRSPAPQQRNFQQQYRPAPRQQMQNSPRRNSGGGNGSFSGSRSFGGGSGSGRAGGRSGSDQRGGRRR